MYLSEKHARQTVKAVKKKWDACVDVRLNHANQWEVAILNTLGGKHWVTERSVPAHASEVLDRVKNELRAL
jgi:hypothetical protein